MPIYYGTTKILAVSQTVSWSLLIAVVVLSIAGLNIAFAVRRCATPSLRYVVLSSSFAIPPSRAMRLPALPCLRFAVHTPALASRCNEPRTIAFCFAMPSASCRSRATAALHVATPQLSVASPSCAGAAQSRAFPSRRAFPRVSFRAALLGLSLPCPSGRCRRCAFRPRRTPRRRTCPCRSCATGLCRAASRSRAIREEAAAGRS